MANDFQKEFKFAGDLYCDKERAVYKALGCNRGLKYVISGKVLEATKKAHNAGFQGGGIAGDVLQLGGVFLINRKQGIVYQHLEEFSGDHVKTDELAAACKQAASNL